MLSVKGYNIYVIKQSACLVVEQITANHFAYLFICTPVGRGSDSMMARQKLLINLAWAALCMSVSWPIGDQLVVFSIPVGLFDTLEISKYLDELCLLSPYLCFIIGFICD